jgi:dTDP-4-dehydrorhamnose reductase
VVGASPDVADAFDALCDVRGLGLRLVSRLDYDFGSPAAADAMLRALTPWAVIDMTAGDTGPRAIASAQPPSHTEHVNLAAACRRRGISLVYWSSSLVFDGGQAPAYSEDDAAQPSSARGVILADIERRVRDVLPEALVIRTGRLFTASDDWVTDALATQPAPAAAAARSGRLTYVPHAIDVMLDLLIDAEQGVWHLVNEEAGFVADASTGGDGQSSCLDAAAPAALHSVRGWLMPALACALAEAATARHAKLQAVHIDRLG